MHLWSIYPASVLGGFTSRQNGLSLVLGKVPNSSRCCYWVNTINLAVHLLLSF